VTIEPIQAIQRLSVTDPNPTSYHSWLDFCYMSVANWKSMCNSNHSPVCKI